MLPPGKKATTGDEILTAAEVAGVLKCSVKTVYKLKQQMQLPARFKFFSGNKGLRWSREDVESYFQRRRIGREDLWLHEPNTSSRPFVPVLSPFQ